MPINKDLSVSPYFDDFDAEKDYYKVLFKPGVAVQVRELNQLQTMLQNQIEKFGNNIYKRGTIIDGCNFVYYPNYSYIKINDSQLDGLSTTPSSYVSHFIVDPTSNLTAHIINSADGFEATDPDLKTLYLRYINSGANNTGTAFSSGSVLKVYDYLDSVHKVNITNGSSGFSNNDAVIFCSALQVNITSNTSFTVGETITQTGNAHSAVVTAIQNIPGKGDVIQIRPTTSDLSNTSVSSTVWEFDVSSDIIGSSSGSTATINEVIGTGASATITTTADIGKIVVVDIVDGGEGYYVEPYVSVKSSGSSGTIGSRNYTDLTLKAQNYIAQITVSSKPNSVGTGYAFGVTEGVIYQKGYFLRVEPQVTIVSKYNPLPDQLAVGFDTLEDVIDSNIDNSLLDNATGQPNEFAPGSDRLELTPSLVVLDSESAEANDEFLTIVEFSEGFPFRNNPQTQFNSIMNEMALRTDEQSGNFVLNEFLVTSSSTSNSANEGQYFSAVVDPGKGYIDGYRVETLSNYYVDVEKGIDSNGVANLTAAINYGNFVYVTEVGGIWDCNVGGTVSLTNSSTAFASNTAAVTAGTITPSGSVLGTARMRNMVWESGEPGTPSAVYRLYLFDINMVAGKNFKDVRGVKIGTSAVADIVTTFDATLNANVCKLQDTVSGSSLLVPTGSNATKNILDLNYVYRTTSSSVSMANTGSSSILLTDSDEYFAYDSTSLTDTEKKTIIMVPGSDIRLYPNTASDGTAAVTSSSNTVTMNSASVNKYNVGDYIALYQNSTTSIIRRVTAKTATTLQLDLTATFTNATSSFSRAFPKNVGVGLHRIPNATVMTSGGGKTLTVNLGTTVDSTSSTTISVTYDVEVQNTSPQAKTADRDNFVKIGLTTATLKGPWCLGIPDIFRLKKVYLGSSSSVSTSDLDVTDQFYIDHNQTADYYGLGYLYKKSNANINLSSSSYLLVQFDAFTSTPGVFTVNSYVSSNRDQRFADDSLALADLGTKTNSFEVPELHTAQGKYFDLINWIDFRPVATATASYAKTATAATVNPGSTLTFSGTNKKFPLPESGVQYTRQHFKGRKDAVVITKDNLIKIIRGTPENNNSVVNVPDGVLHLNSFKIPAYPCLPENFSETMREILDRKLANEKFLLKRIKNKTITLESGSNDISLEQPKGYTMADIGRLERRIKDLEYSVSLSLVESDLKDKVIPSNASPNLNRFKFGFFVDDYSSTAHSDLTSPEYNCQVVDSKVVPVSISVGTSHGPSDPAVGDSVGTFALVQQNLASVPVPVPVPVPAPAPSPSPSPSPVPAPSPTPVPSPSPSPTPVSARTVTLFMSEATTNRAEYANTGWLEFSSVPSTYKVDYNFYSAPDGFKIEKKNSNGTIIVIRPESDLSKTGTLNFTHDPSTGRLYRFTTHFKTNLWEYTLSYPVNDNVYVAPTPPSSGSRATFYDGALISITPGTFQTQAMNQNFGEKAFITLGIKQKVSMASLKPDTKHNIRIENTSHTITVSQSSDLATSSITTDEWGRASFNILVDTTLLSKLDSLRTDVASGEGIANLYVYVESADKTSVGAFVVRVNNVVTAPPPPSPTPAPPPAPPPSPTTSPVGSQPRTGFIFDQIYLNSV